MIGSGFTVKPNMMRRVFVTDFVGKTAGSLIANPHVAKSNYGQTSIQTPSGTWNNGEFATEDYAIFSVLDGVTKSAGTATNLAMAQKLFSFDLINILERAVDGYWGTLPGETLADKIAWLKEDRLNLTFKWNGWGSGPSGNQSLIRVWSKSSSEWSTAGNPVTSHSLGQVSELSLSIDVSSGSSLFDTNGICHYLAYAPASDGVTASTIRTDHVKLEISLKR